jgi:ubiquinone biosynthesis protein COQ9
VTQAHDHGAHDHRAHDHRETAAAVLRASMTHVPFDGWGEAALLAGATDAGFDAETMYAAFPRGAIDAIALHSRLVDQDMVAAFAALPERPRKVHLMIRALVLLRLEIAQPDKEAVRRALAILAMPMHATISAKLLYETVDTMWRAAGQTDTDFNFYTKRATLAAVYSATMLAWLADNSGRLDNIVAFLDRRLGDVARVPKLARPFRAVAGLGKRVARGLASGVAARRSHR